MRRDFGVNLEPRLLLINENGQEVANSFFHGGEALGEAAINAPLKMSGRYTLYATGKFSNTTDTGSFKIDHWLERKTDLAAQDHVRSSIGLYLQQDRYRFKAQRDQSVEISMRRASNADMGPRLHLKHWDNRTGDESDVANSFFQGRETADEATLSVRLSLDGTYVLVATDQSNSFGANGDQYTIVFRQR